MAIATSAEYQHVREVRLPELDKFPIWPMAEDAVITLRHGYVEHIGPHRLVQRFQQSRRVPVEMWNVLHPEMEKRIGIYGPKISRSRVPFLRFFHKSLNCQIQLFSSQGPQKPAVILPHSGFTLVVNLVMVWFSFSSSALRHQQGTPSAGGQELFA